MTESRAFEMEQLVQEISTNLPKDARLISDYLSSKDYKDLSRLSKPELKRLATFLNSKRQIPFNIKNLKNIGDILRNIRINLEAILSKKNPPNLSTPAPSTRQSTNLRHKLSTNSISSLPSSSLATPASSSSSSLACQYSPVELEVLDSLQKKQLFTFILSQVPGLSRDETLEAFRNSSDSDLDPDDILMTIISTRENGLYADLQSQEDLDIDRAIINSEGEREVIQENKRRRVNDISTNCSLGILTLEEFNKSVFLGFTNMYPLSSDVSSNTFNTFPIPGFSSVASPENNSSTHGMKGKTSKFLNDIVSYLDATLCSAVDDSIGHGDTDSCICSCSSDKKALRWNLIKLLLLEKDALKFYKFTSYSYLQQIMDNLDEIYNRYLADQTKIENNNEDSSSGSNGNTSSINVFAHNSSSAESMKFAVDELSKCRSEFELEMYRIPEDEGAVPTAFLEAEKKFNLCKKQVAVAQFELSNDEVIEIDAS